MFKNVDIAVITSKINRRYFSGFETSAGMYLITKDENFFLTDFRYIVDAKSKVKNATIVLIEMGKSYHSVVSDICKKIGATSMGVELENMTVSEFNVFKENYNLDFVDISRDIMLKRNTKTEFELNAMIESQKIIDKVYLELLNFVRAGVTEKEIATEIIYKAHKFGAEGLSFSSIVASGTNGASPHAKPTDKIVEAGDFVTMDFGCILNGYCSDMTRTVAVSHLADDKRRIYDLVLEAQLRGIKTAKAGIGGNLIHEAAASFFRENDMEQYFGHGFGHGIGLEVHEGFGASPRSNEVLGENFVISAEPGLYIKDFCGVRIEDLLILKKDGNQNITGSSKELFIL